MAEVSCWSVETRAYPKILPIVTSSIENCPVGKQKSPRHLGEGQIEGACIPLSAWLGSEPHTQEGVAVELCSADHLLASDPDNLGAVT